MFDGEFVPTGFAGCAKVVYKTRDCVRVSLHNRAIVYHFLKCFRFRKGRITRMSAYLYISIFIIKSGMTKLTFQTMLF